MTLSSIKKSIYSAFVFFGTLVVLSIGYAAYNLSTEISNNPLTVAKWNAVVNAVNDADTRITNLTNTVSSLQSGAGTPNGAVMAFNLSACPTGWIPADGTNGTIDLRGQFIRGLNTSTSGLDPNRTLASAQTSQNLAHSHNFRGGNAATGGTYYNAQYGSSGPSYTFTSTTSVVSDGGTEARPNNIALLYCVKN